MPNNNRIYDSEPGPRMLRGFISSQIENGLTQKSEFPKPSDVYKIPEMEMHFSRYGGDWKSKFRGKYNRLIDEELDRRHCKLRCL